MTNLNFNCILVDRERRYLDLKILLQDSKTFQVGNWYDQGEWLECSCSWNVWFDPDIRDILKENRLMYYHKTMDVSKLLECVREGIDFSYAMMPAVPLEF